MFKLHANFWRKKNILPQGIVTDFSFTFINSIQQVYNQMTINEYLDICFDYLVNNKDLPERLYIKSYLCASHMIKLISKKAKNITKQKEVSQTFTFFFSRLQNCTRFEDFVNVLEKVIIVLASPDKNESVKEALDFLNEPKKEVKSEDEDKKEEDDE